MMLRDRMHKSMITMCLLAIIDSFSLIFDGKLMIPCIPAIINGTVE